MPANVHMPFNIRSLLCPLSAVHTAKVNSRQLYTSWPFCSVFLRAPLHVQFRLPIGLNRWRLKGKTDVYGVAGRPIVGLLDCDNSVSSACRPWRLTGGTNVRGGNSRQAKCSVSPISTCTVKCRLSPAIQPWPRGQRSFIRIWRGVQRSPFIVESTK
jgi:hypothetical protein